MPTWDQTPTWLDERLSWQWQGVSLEGDVLISPTPCCDEDVRIAAGEFDALGQASVRCPADGRSWLVFYVPWVRTREAGWIG